MPQGVRQLFERLQECVRDDDWGAFGEIFAEIDRQGPFEDEDGTTENKDLVRRYFEMWNTGAGVVADAVLGPKYIDHAHPDTVGPAAARSLAPRFHAANPDVQMIVENIRAEGDFVLVRNAIHRRDAVSRGVAFFRISEGKLVEQWSFYPGVGKRSI
jgi:predicted SnoaL-like aldol condensation-catalyzing enzyme